VDGPYAPAIKGERGHHGLSRRRHRGAGFIIIIRTGPEEFDAIAA